jgi:hypothetical protein
MHESKEIDTLPWAMMIVMMGVMEKQTMRGDEANR